MLLFKDRSRKYIWNYWFICCFFCSHSAVHSMQCVSTNRHLMLSISVETA